jgi:glyoxylase-like metal-dependent hydrolase (beta-lactamase superfamily II)
MEGHGFEVAPGIHRIEAPLGDRYVACYLVVDEDALLVDTGLDATPRESILPYCGSIGLAAERVRWVVATHADVDHMGGNATARELFPAATLVAHELDTGLIEDVERIVSERYSEFAAEHGIDVDDGFKAWCRETARATPIDLRVTGGEAIRLGAGRLVRLLATPGHSPGSLSVWDAATQALIVGDAVLGASIRTAAGDDAFPPTYRTPDAYRATIDAVGRLRPELLLTSHYAVMRGPEVGDFLDESRAFADRLEREALAELGDRPDGGTTLELVARLAPRVGTWPEPAWVFLANELVGHLEDLEVAGRVRRIHAEDGRARWMLQEAGR